MLRSNAGKLLLYSVATTYPSYYTADNLAASISPSPQHSSSGASVAEPQSQSQSQSRGGGGKIAMTKAKRIRLNSQVQKMEKIYRENPSPANLLSYQQAKREQEQASSIARPSIDANASVATGEGTAGDLLFDNNTKITQLRSEEKLLKSSLERLRAERDLVKFQNSCEGELNYWRGQIQKKEDALEGLLNARKNGAGVQNAHGAANTATATVTARRAEAGGAGTGSGAVAAAAAAAEEEEGEVAEDTLVDNAENDADGTDDHGVGVDADETSEEFGGQVEEGEEKPIRIPFNSAVREFDVNAVLEVDDVQDSETDMYTDASLSEDDAPVHGGGSSSSSIINHNNRKDDSAGKDGRKPTYIGNASSDAEQLQKVEQRRQKASKKATGKAPSAGKRKVASASKRVKGAAKAAAKTKSKAPVRTRTSAKKSASTVKKAAVTSAKKASAPARTAASKNKKAPTMKSVKKTKTVQIKKKATAKKPKLVKKNVAKKTSTKSAKKGGKKAKK